MEQFRRWALSERPPTSAEDRNPAFRRNLLSTFWVHQKGSHHPQRAEGFLPGLACCGTIQITREDASPNHVFRGPGLGKLKLPAREPRDRATSKQPGKRTTQKGNVTAKTLRRRSSQRKSQVLARSLPAEACPHPCPATSDHTRGRKKSERQTERRPCATHRP